MKPLSNEVKLIIPFPTLAQADPPSANVQMISTRFSEFTFHLSFSLLNIVQS